MLKHVYTKCSPLLLNRCAAVTLSPRLFCQTSFLVQKHNVKKIVKSKKHHRPRPKKKPPEEKPRCEVTERFRSYVESLVLATYDEMESVKERERLLAASLPEDILEVRSESVRLSILFEMNASLYHVLSLSRPGGLYNPLSERK